MDGWLRIAFDNQTKPHIEALFDWEQEPFCKYQFNISVSRSF
jgi:hypothetical protein